jgi:hypothetical protein
VVSQDRCLASADRRERNSSRHAIRNVQLARHRCAYNDAIRAHGIENKWFALTGRVVELKVEEDGDLHIALHDVTGDKPGVAVCEIPAQPQWCEIRTTVFSWTPTRFPFHSGSGKKLTFGKSPVITDGRSVLMKGGIDTGVRFPSPAILIGETSGNYCSGHNTSAEVQRVLRLRERVFAGLTSDMTCRIMQSATQRTAVCQTMP